MDTSVTIIGLVITVLIGIPLYKAFRSSSVNNSKIKAILAQESQSHFDKIDSQNKKTYALDEKNKHFVFIDFNYTPEKIYSIDLNRISACRIVPITEGFTGDIVKIELEFLYKDSGKEIVPVYHIEHDQITQVCLHEDHEMAKKWQQQIIVCLSS